MKHRQLFRRAAAVTALMAAIGAPGVIGLTAVATNALPISTLASECRGAGGTWVVDYDYNSTGIRYVSGYQCFYRDNEGNGYVDFYDAEATTKAAADGSGQGEATGLQPLWPPLR
jgi:hypothetical protein